MHDNPAKRIEDIDKELEGLVKGTLTYKTINGKKQPYLQRTVDGKSVSYYIKQSERENILIEIEKREKLVGEKKALIAYLEGIKGILKNNPYIGRPVSIGYQWFDQIIENDYFYVDKTEFIASWWKRREAVTLISRPRRFGKTLMLSTVENFFSPLVKDNKDNKDNKDAFGKLKVWKYEELRKLHGSIPTIFITFGGVKTDNFKDCLSLTAFTIKKLYWKYDYLSYSSMLSESDIDRFKAVNENLTTDNCTLIYEGIDILANLLYKHHGVKPIILIDEYDTPIQEAFVHGYLQEAIGLFRNIFGHTLKYSNNYCRALLTGTTKISKNGLFSDMNNILVDSVSSGVFGSYFGFTEEEVMDALDCQNIQEKEKVKSWYDGFNFGEVVGIYNPWSITCYMNERVFRPYWIDTSSNDVIGKLIRRSDISLKRDIQNLLEGKNVRKTIDEDLAIQYMDENENSFWSLLYALGYVKGKNIKYDTGYIECDISITNYETQIMFYKQLTKIIEGKTNNCEHFIEDLLRGDMEIFNYNMNKLTEEVMSFFDTGRIGNNPPENFYHGLILGMTVYLRNRYMITSNRESGLGRYDICMKPINSGDKAYIMEFKLQNTKTEKSLKETAERALGQINDMHYEDELIHQGVSKNDIVKLAFAFHGKSVLIVREGSEIFDFTSN